MIIELTAAEKDLLRGALRNYAESTSFMIGDYGPGPYADEERQQRRRMQDDLRRIPNLFQKLELGEP